MSGGRRGDTLPRLSQSPFTMYFGKRDEKGGKINMELLYYGFAQ